jgi:hypothetical protein
VSPNLLPLGTAEAVQQASAPGQLHNPGTLRDDAGRRSALAIQEIRVVHSARELSD